MKNQWERFKHRTLTKVFLGYAVVAWVLIQVVEAVLPTFETPLWVAQTITFLLILGFPVAILVGWASEKLPSLSDNGENPSETPQLAHNTSRGTLVWIGAASCVVVGLFAFYLMPFIFDRDAFVELSTRNSNNGEGRRIASSPRFQLKMENKGTRGNGLQAELSISPSGRYLAYTQFVSPNLTMYLHDFNSFDDPKVMFQTPLNGNTGYPRFSSDGQWIYYHQNSTLMRIRLEGGTPQVVIDSGVQIAGVASSGVDLIYRGVGGLRSYNISTEIDSPLITLDGVELELDYSWPYFIPGSNILIATKGGPGNFVNSSVDLINIDTGEIKILAANGFHGKYIGSGHIVFARDDAVWAQPIDPETFEINGDAAPILFDVELSPARALANFDSSRDGRFVYTSGNLVSGDLGSYEIVSVDIEKKESILDIQEGRYWFPRRNPSLPTVATTVFANDGEPDIWLYDMQNKTLGRRTFSGDSSRAIWSNDGTELIYSCAERNICVTSGDGTSSASTIFEDFQRPFPTYHTSDGTLLISEGDPVQVYTVNLGNMAASETTLTSLNLSPPGTEAEDAQLSSDEKWITYSSNETGRAEIYVRPYPDVTKGKWQISREGGRFPIWDDVRSEVIWVTREFVYSASFQISERPDGTPVISFNNPEYIMPNNFRYTGTVPPYDYSSETGEFYFTRDIDAGEVFERQIKLNIIDGWFNELRGLVPSLTEY